MDGFSLKGRILFSLVKFVCTRGTGRHIDSLGRANAAKDPEILKLYYAEIVACSKNQGVYYVSRPVEQGFCDF